jgi:TRAP-type C4-dicarboxylate transport system permease small subunit
LYAYILIVIFTEVVARYVLKTSIVWAEETSIYAFIWMSYLAMARLARTRSHLAFTLLREQMSPFWQLVCMLIGDACLASLCVIVIVYMWQPVVDSVDFHQTMQGVNLPIWIATIAVPVGFLFVLVRTIQRARESIRQFVQHRELTAGRLEEQIG